MGIIKKESPTGLFKGWKELDSNTLNSRILKNENLRNFETIRRLKITLSKYEQSLKIFQKLLTKL